MCFINQNLKPSQRETKCMHHWETITLQLAGGVLLVDILRKQRN